MFAGRLGYVVLGSSFVLSVLCLSQLTGYHWAVYPAVIFGFLFVVQLMVIIRNSGLSPAVKKNIYLLAVLLMLVILSNIAWVFWFPWFRYVASVMALVFVYVLFIKLRNAVEKK